MTKITHRSKTHRSKTHRSKTHRSKTHRSKTHRSKTQRRRRWSMKYKKSINCNRPKGFSQKQYCKYGRKHIQT